jgi:catechol 2,3-dioxygenase-like lactoylglutathione lyase family enzyme
MPRLLVNIDVDDLEKAVRFYTAALELHVGRRFGARWSSSGAPAPVGESGRRGERRAAL